ncbi:hypothetical protein [Agrococcus sp. ARC_14]|uniref:hypothetical protein n=1 Tax=Agrococcus sp. ARC_14 TaxID=2919927 RepID=UPI001F06FF1A|nr:hypothetical protein [Agrococcus sp. ARC_14]MCH1881503.1 hypothetical protein [Agrococcus sp. ARC_14]
MSAVVRLHGEDCRVVAVADAALRSIGTEHAKWMADARRLHLARRALMSQLGSRPSSARVREPSGKARPTAWSRIWWIGLSIGTAASFVGSAPMLPPRHPQDPELTMMITPPAIFAAAVLLLVAAATVPRSGRSPTAVGLAAMSGVIVLAALLFSLFRADVLTDAGGPMGVAAWAVGAAGALVGSTVLVLRTRSRTRGSRADRAAAETGKAWRRAAVELRGEAKRLLRRAPADAAVLERWADELAWLEGEVSAEQLAQARELGPWGWLVWSAYDGETALPALLAR